MQFDSDTQYNLHCAFCCKSC